MKSGPPKSAGWARGKRSKYFRTQNIKRMENYVHKQDIVSDSFTSTCKEVISAAQSVRKEHIETVNGEMFENKNKVVCLEKELIYLNENERRYNRKKANNPPSKTSDFNLNNNRKSGYAVSEDSHSFC